MFVGRCWRSCKSGAAPPARRPLRRRPRLEVLEDRTVPSAMLPDDFGNTLADAHLLSLSALGAGSQKGVIDYGGDVDVFRFVAPLAGRMTIHLDAVAPGVLDPILSAYDAAGVQLASND